MMRPASPPRIVDPTHSRRGKRTRTMSRATYWDGDRAGTAPRIQARPRRTAKVAAAVRVGASSLVRMLATWLVTVR
jgi:hypothetical protein